MQGYKKIFCILPMKKNSERVPGKNIRILGNKPLFYHIADTIFETKLFNNLIINTDSEEIMKMAKKRYNDWVVIHKRPGSLCGDLIPMNDIISNDLNRFKGQHFLQTHSTNPLLKKDTIISAVKKYFENLNFYDSLFSVNKLTVRLFDKKINPINHKPGELIRTQDLDPIYEENSNFYIFSRLSFKLAAKNRIGINPKLFEINKLESIDIDEDEDFFVAESIYNRLVKNEFETKNKIK